MMLYESLHIVIEILFYGISLTQIKIFFCKLWGGGELHPTPPPTTTKQQVVSTSCFKLIYLTVKLQNFLYSENMVFLLNSSIDLNYFSFGLIFKITM